MIQSTLLSFWNHIVDSSLAPFLILSLISLPVIALSDRKTKIRAARKESTIQAR